MWIRYLYGNTVFIYILAAIVCFANLKVKVTKYRILSDRFEFSTPKLCENKWIKNYTLYNADTKSVRIGPFIAKIWLFSKLELHFGEHSEKHPLC